MSCQGPLLECMVISFSCKQQPPPGLSWTPFFTQAFPGFPLSPQKSHRQPRNTCDRLWKMSSPQFLPHGTYPTHHHHFPAVPMFSLLAPGSKRSRQKISHHVCLKMHFSFARFALKLSHRLEERLLCFCTVTIICKA